jgi:hyperosmotically inducible protein
MRTALTLIAVSTSLLVTLALPACSRNESQTVGQGVDKVIDDVKATGEAAKAATEDAGKSMAANAADAALTLKVSAALMADTSLKIMKVDVDTKDGLVTLTGAAPDADVREQATALVKAIDGVKDVDNQLRVQAKS